MQVRKAVFPVAGLGTRFLPATKAIAKEMLPIVDKPLIQYAAEEAMAAGITDLIFIVGRSKEAIANHFDKAYELETELNKSNKQPLLDLARSTTPQGVNCIFIRQPEALGLGHAVLCARAAVGDEPFAVILPDDLIASTDGGCIKQMVEVFNARAGSSVLAVETVPQQDTQRYGVVKAERVSPNLSQVQTIVEKPRREVAPSNLAVVGRYILTPRIFTLLEQTGMGAGGEIQLTDGIAKLLQYESVFAYEFSGKRYDCGTKLGFLQATVEFGLKHPELGAEFSAYLHNVTR